jgi:hypothetical protein
MSSTERDREYHESLMKDVRKFEAEAAARRRLRDELEATGREPVPCPVCSNKTSAQRLIEPTCVRCNGVGYV